jgi:2-polyprenyl-6-methoxyphenol hydroxylase and related FAD-dependent oxidoreductases
VIDDPVTKWVDRKVAVLGDAAHPMLQYLAQGACMAIEDAVCLSEEVKNEKENIEQALINYQNKRMLRTTRVQLHSRQIGKHVYHADGVHALLRNQIMKSKTQDDWYNDIEWLYGRTRLDN